ncbi:alpha/beta hydrolase [Kordiimonas aquimaris]|uniref:alpha/beta hydrolase n=1 Tax=Kordiimonas aquimaris TaxID=707591 RepID=UPI0021D11547|nr:alpha/beta hydrolase-fold protein [Kordiimonas aquimaris]
MRIKFLKIIKWATGVMLVAFFVYCAAFLRAGETHIIQSSVLGENRSISVYLPYGYETDGKQTYPVVYSLDGEKWRHGAIIAANARFLSTMGFADAAIVIAVHTEGHRVRDYVPSNNATSFLQFLKVEIIPWVESRYRVNTHRALSGHSLGGLFTLYALAQEPALFQAYFAYDPSILRDDNLLSKVAQVIENGGADGTYLYVNFGFHTERYRQRMNDLWLIMQQNQTRLTHTRKTYYPLPHSLIMLPGQLEAMLNAR